MAPAVTATITRTSYTFEGLAPGTLVNYMVRAISSDLFLYRSSKLAEGSFTVPQPT